MEDRFGLKEKEYCSECGSSSMYEDEKGGDETIYEIHLEEDSPMYDMLVGGEGEDFYPDENYDAGAYNDEEEISEDKLQRHNRTSGKQRYHGARFAARESKTVRKPLVNRKPIVNTVSESKIMREYEELKSKNEEYKKALNIFKDKLNEVALFNTNLAYVNRLFTEHSTTKKEKMDILKRFDNAETIKESKNIYKTIKSEMDNKKPINESVENKVNKTVKSYTATNLNESTAYVDPQITAIKDLMRRIS
jgi:ATP-dependent Lon protease